MLAGLVAALASVVGACSDSSSKTDLLGQPKVLQVMVSTPIDPNTGASNPISCTELDADGACLDPLIDPVCINTGACIANFELTYGTQADYNHCGFDENEQRLGDCPKTAEGVQLMCATSGDNKGHCIDPATGTNPTVAHAMPDGTVIRVVVGDLLNGKTLEEFACQCQGTDLGMLDPANCPAGKEWSLDPFNCGECGGDSSNQGKCLDTDNNGLPDISALLPGVATITCGSLLTMQTGVGDGYYYPSGNQLLSSQIGFQGMGPAIVITPSFTLPTDTDCTLSISDSVKDKAGKSLDQTGGPYKFHTDKFGLDLVNSAPAADDTGISTTKPDGTTNELTIAFNAPVDPKSVTDASVVVAEKGGATIAGTTVDVDANTLLVTLPGALKAGTTYTVTVKGTVGDTFNKKLGADQAPYSFKTKAAM